MRAFGGATAVPATRAVVSWFDNNRALAVGVVTGIIGLGAALGMVGVVIIGLQVHLVPMMTDRGLSNDQAGQLLVIFGLASLVGRVVGGVVIDRVHGSIVGPIVPHG